MTKIPGWKSLELKNIVFDYNGTLAHKGKVKNGVLEHLSLLTSKYKVYVITADTYGTVSEAFKDIDVNLLILKNKTGTIEKANWVKELGPEHTIAIGNGRNDRDMLAIASVGIAVCGSEGLAVETLMSADVVVHDIIDAISMIQNPKALIATLRE